MGWCVLDMDDGILREEVTRRAAKEWALHFHGEVRFTGAHRYMGGWYDYFLPEGGQVSIVRRDMLDAYGLTVEHRLAGPVYPFPNDPFQMREDAP